LGINNSDESDATWAARATFILANLSSYNYDVPPTLLGSLLSDFNTGSAYLHYPQQKLAELLQDHLKNGSARRTRALCVRKPLTRRDIINFEEDSDDELPSFRLLAPPIIPKSVDKERKPGQKYPRIQGTKALLPYSPQHTQRSRQRRLSLGLRANSNQSGGARSLGLRTSSNQSGGAREDWSGPTRLKPKLQEDEHAGRREFSWNRGQKATGRQNFKLYNTL